MYQRLLDVSYEKNDGYNVKVVVQTAAAGAIGKMIDRQFRSKGIFVINVVRKDTQVEILNNLGGDRGLQTNLNSSLDTFEQDFKSELNNISNNVK